jgi:hypothetical protein
MAKKTPKAGTRGPAKEINQGDAKVGKTSAGKPRKVLKGSTKAAEKVPGAIKGY